MTKTIAVPAETRVQRVIREFGDAIEVGIPLDLRVDCGFAGRTVPLPLPARSRSLPVAPVAAPSRRRLPLADAAREVDARWRPIYAVWEITLRCDLACRHCGSRAGRERPDELTTVSYTHLTLPTILRV